MKRSISVVKETTIKITMNPPDSTELSLLCLKLQRSISLIPNCPPNTLAVHLDFSGISISYTHEPIWESLQLAFRQKFGSALDNIINNEDLMAEQNNVSEPMSVNSIEASPAFTDDDFLGAINGANSTDNILGQFLSSNIDGYASTPFTNDGSDEVSNSFLTSYCDSQSLSSNSDESTSISFSNDGSDEVSNSFLTSYCDSQSLSSNSDESTSISSSNDGSDEISNSFLTSYCDSQSLSSNSDESTSISSSNDGSDEVSNSFLTSYSDSQSLSSNSDESTSKSSSNDGGDANDDDSQFANPDHVQTVSLDKSCAVVNTSNQNEISPPLKTRFSTLLDDFDFISEGHNSYYRLKPEVPANRKHLYQSDWSKHMSGINKFLLVEVSTLKTFIEKLYGLEAFQDPKTLPHINHFHQFYGSTYCLSFTDTTYFQSTLNHLRGLVEHLKTQDAFFHKIVISTRKGNRNARGPLQILLSQENIHLFYKYKENNLLDHYTQQQTSSRLLTASLFAPHPVLHTLANQGSVVGEAPNKRARRNSNVGAR